jgi:hypothetical protein
VPVIDRPQWWLSPGTSVLGVQVEEASDFDGQDVAFAFQPTIGDADCLVASDLASSVLCPVALERCPMSVECIAIELDDHSLEGPKRIDLVIEDFDVGLVGRKSLLTAEEGEARLKLAANADRIARFLDQAPDRSERPSPVTAGADVFESPHLEQAKAIGLFERSLESELVDYIGKVEERAGNGGDGDARDRCPIVLVDTAFMHGNARAASTYRSRNINRPGARTLHQSPQCRRASMAQQRPVPTGENRSHPFCPRFNSSGGKRVHATMENVETSRFDSTVDRSQAQSACEQLPAGQDAVLPMRQGRKLSFALRQRLALPLFSTCR